MIPHREAGRSARGRSVFLFYVVNRCVQVRPQEGLLCFSLPVAGISDLWWEVYKLAFPLMSPSYWNYGLIKYRQNWEGEVCLVTVNS